ncbi:MAG TPA: FHIPEP family type III secretion protein, partial [Devosiaceae bacterium]|nr:FHIPEP family type III secretion protein [Devosiaceae bacterium]
MADITSAGAPSTGRLSGFRLPSLKEIGGVLRSTDVGLAIGVMAIIVVLILPMPSMLLDALLAVSIIFSVLIMMTALFIQAPLEFSSFPTVLLIAAMLRLALNLASTRLILA